MGAVLWFAPQLFSGSIELSAVDHFIVGIFVRFVIVVKMLLDTFLLFAFV